MALKQISARTEGDVFQGLFFWRQAAGLFIPETRVSRVDYEHDKAAGVDDIAVFYEPPGVNAGRYMCQADFYQIKYHVDQREAYCSDAFIDPQFIGAKKSLLQRFHNAYQQMVPEYPSLRLNFASNWRWKADDPLARSLREDDGRLPEEFFTSLENTKIGEIRKKWQQHLALEQDEKTFRSFAEKLRFELDHFGRRHFRDHVHDRLARAGLQPPPDDHSASQYESLIQQFVMSGQNSFDRATLSEICERHGLRISSTQTESGCSRCVGVRSFVRFAENLEGEVDDFICVMSQFKGRHPRTENSWISAAKQITRFLSDPEQRKLLRSDESAIMLECHGSLALLSGYELSRNSGCSIYPLQKPGRKLWKPDLSKKSDTQEEWKEEVRSRDEKAKDMAIILSVTFDIVKEVEAYLDSLNAPKVHSMVCLTPSSGPGPDAVKGPEHAWRLAEAFVTTIRRVRILPVTRIHLFSSSPNALLFFIGQFREALGSITLYEYDFGLERDGSYIASITLPQQREAWDGIIE